jgi:hypothetical protein
VDEMMTSVTIMGWRPGLKSISFIKLVRESGGKERSLTEAKAMVDEMMGGNRSLGTSHLKTPQAHSSKRPMLWA